MTLVVHLSDLHLRQNHQAQSLVFQKLVSALQSERERAQSEHVSVVVTGDVFDSATDPADALVEWPTSRRAGTEQIAVLEDPSRGR